MIKQSDDDELRKTSNFNKKGNNALAMIVLIMA